MAGQNRWPKFPKQICPTAKPSGGTATILLFLECNNVAIIAPYIITTCLFPLFNLPHCGRLSWKVLLAALLYILAFLSSLRFARLLVPFGSDNGTPQRARRWDLHTDRPILAEGCRLPGRRHVQVCRPKFNQSQKARSTANGFDCC